MVWGVQGLYTGEAKSMVATSLTQLDSSAVTGITERPAEYLESHWSPAHVGRLKTQCSDGNERGQP